VWSHDPKNYATGRASHARQVKVDDPNKKGYPGPPGWGFGVGLTISHSEKLIVTKVEQRKSWMDLMMMGRVGDREEKWKDLVRQAKAHSGL
jgi:hypothetical protein